MAERSRKRDTLADQGIDPYPYRFDRTALAAELQQRHGGLAPDTRTGETVRVAGRLKAVRGHGELSFATLAGRRGSVQLLIAGRTSATGQGGPRRSTWGTGSGPRGR